MSIIVDIIILLIVLTCVFLGYKKGLIGAVLSILGFLIALLIAFALYTPISNFIIDNTQVKSTIQNAISNKVTVYIVGDSTEENVDEEKEDNSSQVMNDYIDEFIEKEKTKIETTEREVINNVSENVAINIIRIAVGIIVFIVAKIGLIFIQALAKLITKLPIIGQFDKAGGVLYGILQSLVIIYVILALISLVSPMIEDSMILDAINSSLIGKMMYNNNIILKFIFK